MQETHILCLVLLLLRVRAVCSGYYFLTLLLGLSCTSSAPGSNVSKYRVTKKSTCDVHPHKLSQCFVRKSLLCLKQMFSQCMLSKCTKRDKGGPENSAHIFDDGAHSCSRLSGANTIYTTQKKSLAHTHTPLSWVPTPFYRRLDPNKETG